MFSIKADCDLRLVPGAEQAAHRDNQLALAGSHGGWRAQVAAFLLLLLPQVFPRGAIAFAMVAEYDGPYNKRFYDCTILVILFTTLVQVGFITCSNTFYLWPGDCGEAPGGDAAAEEGQGEEPKDQGDPAVP